VIGDKFIDATYRIENDQMIGCDAEFEVIAIDIQTKEDGSIAIVENVALVCYLD